MRQVTWYLSLFLFCVVATSMVGAQEAIIISEAAIDPVQQGMLTSDDVYGPEIAHHAERQKRKLLEPVVQASFGIKSSLLNLIFGKVNQLIDYKTRLVSELDKKNVALNKQYGLYANKQPCDDHTTATPAYQGFHPTTGFQGIQPSTNGYNGYQPSTNQAYLPPTTGFQGYQY